MRRSIAHKLLLSLGIAAPTLGCGAAATNHASSADLELPPRAREVSSPRVCLGKRRLLEELGHDALAEAAANMATSSEPEPQLTRGTPPPIEAAYGVTAPATVLIRTSEGMGSGVIVDKSGLVLTNQHVIEEFLQPDLTIKVSLEIANVGPTGRVIPSGKSLSGVVVKADALRDLALVRIEDPPADLPVATLAPTDPRVGETVLSVGNAGIGLMWAAKVCNVSRIGDLTRETSMLEAADCSLRDPGDDEDEAKRKREQCEAQKREIKERVEESPQGLVIQTTCALNGGDSGGPLVNAWGEVVGLNESVRFGANTLAFHVHVAEIREFLQEVPDRVAAIVPDPYCEGATDFRVDDLDGDGVLDTATASGTPEFEGGVMKPQGTYLFDLRAKTASLEPSADRPFHADLAVLLQGADAYVLYDRDGDGAFDLLLRDRKADGEPEYAFTLSDDGTSVQAAALPSSTLDPSLFGGESIGARLASMVLGSGLVQLASDEVLANVAVPPLPNVRTVAGDRGYAVDVDNDQKPDAIYTNLGPASSGYLVDVHSPSLAGLKPGDEAAPVLEAWSIDPQFVYLERAAGTWSLYDTDGDRALDLALFGKKPKASADDVFSTPTFVTHAFSIEEGSLGAARPELVGRFLVIADLVQDDRLRKAIFDGPMGRRGTRGNFPDPASGHGGDWTYIALELERQGLLLEESDGRMLIVDLDRDTSKLMVNTAPAIATSDDLDYEIALLRHRDQAWAFYDTNADGAYDVVLYSNDARNGTVDNAVRLLPDGSDASEPPPHDSLFMPGLVSMSPRAAAAIQAQFDAILSADLDPPKAGNALPPPPPPPPPGS